VPKRQGFPETTLVGRGFRNGGGLDIGLAKVAVVEHSENLIKFRAPAGVKAGR
jgi:hypothetical protein